jgi:hypothetical protein
MNQVAEIKELQDREGLVDSAVEGRAEAAQRGRWARLASVAALAVVLALLGRGAVAGYLAATDAFVAPVSLSSDSDVVLQDRLALGRLISERESLSARVAEGASAVESLRASIDLLRGLESSTSNSLGWVQDQVKREQVFGATDRDLLRRQQRELETTAERQRTYVEGLERSLAAGLIRSVELERERDHLGQVELALLQNRREQAEAEASERRTEAVTRALEAGPRPVLATPEMQAHRELTTRIRVDLLRAGSELSGRLARLAADREQLGRVDELVAQLREKPTLKAVDGSQYLAFATYGELGEIRPGSRVYQCPVWGLFGCSQVGMVSRLLPGEVSSHDTWGIAARGQYLLLDLEKPTAAQARALRVRSAVSDSPAQGTAVTSR